MRSFGVCFSFLCLTASNLFLSRLGAQQIPESAPPKSTADADAIFRKFLDQVWEWELNEDPFLATEAAETRFQDRLPDERQSSIERRAKQREQFLEQLAIIDRNALSADTRIDYEVLRRRLHDALQEFRFKNHLMPLMGRSGFHLSLLELSDSMRLETLKHYQDYLSRLREIPRYMAEQTELMRAGMASGHTTPAIVLRETSQQLRPITETTPEKSVFFRAFTKAPPARITNEQWAALRKEATEVIEQHVFPAYRQFVTFFETEYYPTCRSTIGAVALPQGRDFYRHRIGSFTTLDLSAEEIHQIGLQEVARIRKEMEACQQKVGFKGSLPEFIQSLREDPKHYASSRQELLEYVALILKRIDGSLPKAFGKLPRTPYGLKEIPDFVAPQTSSAYYFPAAADGSRAGFFYLNTYNLAQRPKFEMEALSLHEAVPGHHLQIALQLELNDLHAIRRLAGFTAYVEGWALYSERLGLELGFFEDPYQDFGRLSMEAWRACRLVVDTGMHALGWSREQSIEFMRANTALTEHNIVSEVDRYIAWPGQALGYKMGQLKILELRQKAETELGEGFDLREFHDEVLRHGAIPLDLLEENVNQWIKLSAKEK